MRKIVRALSDISNEERESWLGQGYALDLETSGKVYRQSEIVGVALRLEDGRSYYLVRKHTVPMWTGSTIVQSFLRDTEITLLLAPLIAQPNEVVVCHNMKFEIGFVHNFGLRFLGRAFDTLLAAQLLDENRANDLKSLAPSVGIVYDKYQTMVSYAGYSKNEILGAPLDQVAEYAMNDTEATWRLYEKFKKELEGQPFETLFYDVWMPLMVTLQEMEHRGIKVDKAKVQETLDEHKEITDGYRIKIERAGLEMLLAYKPEEIPNTYLQVCDPELLATAYEANDGYTRVTIHGVDVPVITHDMKGRTKRWAPRIPTFNAGSDDQLRELIFRHLGLGTNLPIELKRTESGEISVDKDNLNTLVFFSDGRVPEILENVLAWRKSEKFVNTYLGTLMSEPDEHDRIHTSFYQSVSDWGKGGTVTGRLSSANPNLQNQPSRGPIGRQCRNLYIAEDGHVLVVGDYGSMELRMAAHYSQDAMLNEAFIEGKDLHCLTAAGQNEIDYDTFYAEYKNENPLYEDMRMVGKTSNFALLYGMGAAKFQRYLLVENKKWVEIEEATRLISLFNETYPELTAWKERAIKYGTQLGYGLALGGQMRRLPELRSRQRWVRLKAERQLVNFIIQSSCAYVMCQAIPPVNDMLKSLGGGLLLTVHDECVGTVPEHNADLAAALMGQLMNGQINPRLRTPLITKVGIGHTWGDAK